MDDTVGSIWTHWHVHPDALIGLGLLQAVYLVGIGPLRKRYYPSAKARPSQTALFTTGITIIFIALISPIHELSDQYFFSIHMVQHVLLSLVAPPLLILGIPDWLIRPIIRPNWSFRIVKFSIHPLIAFTSFNVVFSLWHLPVLYNLSVTNHGIHIGEHLMFMSTSIIMWMPIASTIPELPRLSYPFRMVYLFLLSIAQIIVFAPITFSKEPLYQFYVMAPRIWNVSPITDQQIGGIIMKVGSGVLFLALFIVVFFKWFNTEKENNAITQTNKENLW